MGLEKQTGIIGAIPRFGPILGSLSHISPTFRENIVKIQIVMSSKNGESQPMSAKWIKSPYPGVRYREHHERKFNGKQDRYFAIRYYHQDKSIEEGCGWSSEGWNAQKANILRGELVNNNRHGIRPMTLAEKRLLDTEARQAEEQARIQKEQEQKDIEKANITFETLFERFIEWAKQNKKSWEDDMGRYQFNIKEYIGNKPAKDVCTFDLERMKTGLKKAGKSPKTIHHALSLVRSVYNKAILWDCFSGENPARKVSFPKITDNDRVRFLSFDEVNRLLNELKKICHPDMYDLTLMAAFTGARYGELASLTWNDVNFESGFVTFLNTKTRKNRVVPITFQVKEMLLSRKQGSSSQLVFPSRSGDIRKEAGNSFFNAVNRLFNQDVSDRRQKVCFHTLRHSYISWLIMSGADMRTVQQISGHESMAMLKRYSHLTNDHVKKAADRVALAFSQSKQAENIIEMAAHKAR